MATPPKRPDVTVTRIGDTAFDENGSPEEQAPSAVEEAAAVALLPGAAARPELPPSLLPITEPGIDSLMGVIMDPLREDVPPLPDSLTPISPTIGEKAGQIGLGLGEGGLRYGAPSAAAVAAFNATTPYAAMVPVPQARLIPFVAAAGAYGGTYLLGDTLADFFPAPPREELVPERQGGVTAGGILFGAPSLLLAQAPSALYVGNGLGSRVYKTIDFMTQSARRNPKAYLGAEALTATAAGLAGGASEAYYPGDAGMRFASEFGASVFTPGRLLLNGATTGYNVVKNLVAQKFSDSAVDTARANRLYSILDNVLKQSKPIQQLEQLGTPEALAQAQAMRERYYRNLIKRLETDFDIDARPTAAQATGDPGLAILEESLAKGDAAFRARITEQGKLALRANQMLIQALQNVGSPVALKTAAEMQAQLYDSMILGRIGIAERQAADAVSKISRDSPQNRMLIGDVIKRNVEESLDEARDYEKLLWRQAYQQSTKVRKGEIVPRQVVPKKTLTSFLDVVSNMTPERYASMPSEIRSIMTRLGINDYAIASYKRGMRTPEYLETGRVPDEYLIGGVRQARNYKPVFLPLGNKTDVDELIRIRSDMLGWARDAASSKGQRSPTDARMYGMLAESILDDFSQLNTAAYDRARAFSKSLNDNFTRSYARDITAVTKAGAERLPAELLVSRMFGRDSDLTYARMEQVEDAVGFFGQQFDALSQQLVQLRAAKAPPRQIGIVKQQLEELRPLAELSRERVVSVTDAMDRVLRLAMTDPTIVNPQTGRVNAQALANWMTRNEATLNKFGSLKNDLKNALDAENALAAMNDPNSVVARQLRDQQAFSSVLAGGEKPAAAVSDVLMGRTPVTGMRDLIKVANTAQDREAAVRGLKASVYEWAYTKAGGTGNQFSVKAFDDNLFKPLAPGQPSIINILRTQGLMTSDEIKNLRRMLATSRRIQQAQGNKVFIENILGGGSPLEAFAVRFVALHGTSAAIPSGPGSLAAASAVSNTAQQVFNQMPRLNALAGLREAMENPRLMAALLRKGRTDEDKLAFLRDVQNQFSRAGILASGSQRAVVPILNVTEQRQEDVARQRQEARGPRVQPPAPTTRGLPGAPGPGAARPPAGGGAPPTTGAPTQSRQMLQQLFPNDAVLGAAALAQNPMMQAPPAA